MTSSEILCTMRQETNRQDMNLLSVKRPETHLHVVVDGIGIAVNQIYIHDFALPFLVSEHELMTATLTCDLCMTVSPYIRRYCVSRLRRNHSKRVPGNSTYVIPSLSFVKPNYQYWKAIRYGTQGIVNV